MEFNNKHRLIGREELLNTAEIKDLKNKEHIEKNYFQDLFLYYLYKETNKLVFKGGTALYKLYDLKRFSEDLDFSLLENVDNNAIKEIIEKTVKKIGGFEIKNIKEMNNSMIIKISCEGILTKENRLRIDISLKNKVLEKSDIKNYIPEYIDINPFSLKVLKPEEIISEKIHSLLNRKKARDLYDLFFLLKQFKFNKNLTEKKLEIFNQKYSFNKVKKRIGSLNSIWKNELKHLTLGELPEFEPVKKFVLKKLK